MNKKLFGHWGPGGGERLGGRGWRVSFDNPKKVKWDFDADCARGAEVAKVAGMRGPKRQS